MNVLPVAAILLAVLFVLLGQLNSFHAARRVAEAHTAYLDRRLEVSTQAVVDALVAQLAKAKDEIVAKLEAATSDVQSQLVDAGVADQVDLSALAAIAQQLDDIVPDEVAVDSEVEGAVDGDEVELVDLDDEEVVAVDEAVEVEDDEEVVAVDEAVEVEDDEVLVEDDEDDTAV